MVEAWQPATELEGRMRDALDSGDQESYFGLLAETELVIPVPSDLVEEVLANRAQPTWPTQELDGRTHVLAFTSPEAMRACIGSGVQHFMRLKFGDIAEAWPRPQWWLAVNAGLPIQALLPAWFVKQAADGDARPPRAGLTAADAAAAYAVPERAAGIQSAPVTEPARPDAATADMSTPSATTAAASADTAAGGMTAGDLPPGDTTTDGGTAQEGTAQDTTAQETTADETTAQEATAQEATAEETTAQDTTAQETTAQETTAQEATAQETTAQDTTAQETTAQEATAEETTAQDTTIQDTTAPEITAHGITAQKGTAEEATPPNGATAHARAAGDAPYAGTPQPADGLSTAAGPPTVEDLPPAALLPPTGHAAHAQRADDFQPANDVERQLLRAGGDKDAFIKALIGAEVLILVPEHTDRTRRPGRPGFPWQPAQVDGETTIALFTSPDRMFEVLGEVPGPGSAGTTDFMKFPFASVIRYWPDRRWGLSLNAGTKVAASLSGEQLLALAQWADQMAAQRIAERFEPQNDLERRLFDAAVRRDTDAFFKILQAAQVMMPADPETPWGIQPGDPGFPWRPVAVQGDDSIQMFTSLKWMHDAIGPSRYIMPSFLDIVSAWPDSGWTLVLNPGSPIDATVAGEQVAALRPQPEAEPQPQPHAAAEPVTGPDPGAAPAPDPLPRFEPGNRIDQELYEAAASGDTDVFLRVLLGANVLVPIPAHAPLELTPMDPQFQWGAALRDPSSVQIFTSLVQLRETLAGPAGAERTGPEPRFVYTDFRDLIGCWPHAEWTMLLNPGTRIGASLRGDQVQALSEWAIRIGLVRRADAEPQPQPQPAPSQPSPAQAERFQAPRARPARPPSVLQKVLPHDHVPWYLDQGYDRVGGFVHLAADVTDLQTPEQLYEVLGLLHADSAFSTDDEGVYVIRWTAHCADLYRIPFGGRSEEELRLWGDAGWVVEHPPFHGDGFAPGSSGTIREYKVDSVRLPYGAEMYYLGRDRSERFVAVYDPDLLTWLRPGDDPEADPGGRTEAAQ